MRSGLISGAVGFELKLRLGREALDVVTISVP
jgi:hypothetical protein